MQMLVTSYLVARQIWMAAKKSGNPGKARYSKGVVSAGHHAPAGRLSLRQRKLQFAERGDQPDDDFMITTASAIIVSKPVNQQLAIRSVP